MTIKGIIPRTVKREILKRLKPFWEYAPKEKYTERIELEQIVETIVKNTEISTAHLTTEMKLFLLTTNCPLYHRPLEFENAEEDRISKIIFNDPFWSIYWPGGQGLARFILDERHRLLDYPDRGETRKVLDLGCGCGATAIAAKLIGVDCVTANDTNAVACVATAMNAAMNNVDVELSCENLLHNSLEEAYDAIFVGDLLYDEGISCELTPWLDDAFRRGARVYVGDPGRYGLTDNFKKRLTLLRRYPLPENVRKENHGYDSTNVWELSKT